MEIRATLEVDGVVGVSASDLVGLEGVTVSVDDKGLPGDLFIGGRRVGKAVAWPRVTEAVEVDLVQYPVVTAVDCLLTFE